LPLENPLSYEPRSVSSAKLPDDRHYHLTAGPFEVRNSCRVLLVDDDPLVRARLSALLNASQYDVELAATGEEAARILDATRCHIVLTDWQMPDMDGLALCRHIRLRHCESHIYVLMLTIRDGEHDIATGLAAGADAYVVKGATINDFLARLEIGRRITCDTYPALGKHHDNRALSHTDPVTGAHNLGYLMHHLPRELARSQRYGHPLAILHCALDGFNRFNEQFGHEAANEWLRTFVAGAAGCIRQGDWLARTSGAEFMIVLPETAAKGAHCAADKLRRLFVQHQLSTPAEPIGFTVGIGVTAVEAKHDSQSTAQVEAVLRVASRGACGSDGDHTKVGATICTSGSGAQIGAKNELN
jgi:two-component system cell cycle response regulator